VNQFKFLEALNYRYDPQLIFEFYLKNFII